MSKKEIKNQEEEVMDAPIKKAPVKKGKKDEMEEILEHHPEYIGHESELSKHDIKEIHKVDDLEKYYEKPLHFHFLSFLIHFAIFALASIVVAWGVLFLYNDGLANVVADANDATRFAVYGLGITVAFAFVIGEFQLAWRRFFRIGRIYRVRKAEEKHSKKLEKYKEKHLPKVE